MKPEDQKTRHPFRCTCPTTPLLAYYGVNEQNEAYVHVASFKNKQTLSQVYTTSSTSVWCRVCGKWWKINIRRERVSAEVRHNPPPVPRQESRSRVLLDNRENDN